MIIGVIWSVLNQAIWAGYTLASKIKPPTILLTSNLFKLLYLWLNWEDSSQGKIFETLFKANVKLCDNSLILKKFLCFHSLSIYHLLKRINQLKKKIVLFRSNWFIFSETKELGKVSIHNLGLCQRLAFTETTTTCVTNMSCKSWNFSLS